MIAIALWFTDSRSSSAVTGFSDRDASSVTGSATWGETKMDRGGVPERFQCDPLPPKSFLLLDRGLSATMERGVSMFRKQTFLVLDYGPTLAVRTSKFAE